MALPVSLNVTCHSARPKSVSAHFYLNEIPILFVCIFIYFYGSNTTLLNLSVRSLSTFLILVKTSIPLVYYHCLWNLPLKYHSVASSPNSYCHCVSTGTYQHKHEFENQVVINLYLESATY